MGLNPREKKNRGEQSRWHCPFKNPSPWCKYDALLSKQNNINSWILINANLCTIFCQNPNLSGQASPANHCCIGFAVGGYQLCCGGGKTSALPMHGVFSGTVRWYIGETKTPRELTDIYLPLPTENLQLINLWNFGEFFANRILYWLILFLMYLIGEKSHFFYQIKWCAV